MPDVGLITTEGFRDVLEIGRQMRHQMYDLVLDPETPTFLAPGRFRREVRERVSATGEVLKRSTRLPSPPRQTSWSRPAPGDRGRVPVLVPQPAHERRAREIIAARHPDVFVSVSCEVDPAFREYERTVVTAFDAYVKPVVDRYLANLDAGLFAAHGVRPHCRSCSRAAASRARRRRGAPGAAVPFGAGRRRDRRPHGR